MEKQSGRQTLIICLRREKGAEDEREVTQGALVEGREEALWRGKKLLERK